MTDTSENGGSTFIITESTDCTYYDISGNNRTANSPNGGSSITSSYFATESYFTEVPHGNIEENLNITW